MQRGHIRPTNDQLESVRRPKVKSTVEFWNSLSPDEQNHFKTIAKATKYCKCGKKALYKVGKVGYCKDHESEARKSLKSY